MERFRAYVEGGPSEGTILRDEKINVIISFTYYNSIFLNITKQRYGVNIISVSSISHNNNKVLNSSVLDTNFVSQIPIQEFSVTLQKKWYILLTIKTFEMALTCVYAYGLKLMRHNQFFVLSF